METIDIVLLILLGVGTYRGFQTGLLLQLLGIIAFFLAIIGGFHFMYWGAEWLEQYLEGYEALLPIISFIAVFIIILVVINLIGKGLKSILDMTLLGSFDSITGAIAGLLKWTLVLSLLIWFVSNYLYYPLDDIGEDAIVYPLVASLAPLLFDALSALLPYLQNLTLPGNDYQQALLFIGENIDFHKGFTS